MPREPYERRTSTRGPTHWGSAVNSDETPPADPYPSLKEDVDVVLRRGVSCPRGRPHDDPGVVPWFEAANPDVDGTRHTRSRTLIRNGGRPCLATPDNATPLTRAPSPEREIRQPTGGHTPRSSKTRSAGAFANEVGEEEAKQLYTNFAARASGKSLFWTATANLNPWTEAKVNTKNPDRGQDHTVPWAIVDASRKQQQQDNQGVTESRESRPGTRADHRQRLACGRRQGARIRPAVRQELTPTTYTMAVRVWPRQAAPTPMRLRPTRMVPVSETRGQWMVASVCTGSA
jgi:hypothetical protein